MWIEVLKILATSAVIAAILSFVFNKKLQKQKMLLNVNEQYLSSLIAGLNEFLGSFKSVLVKAEEIGSDLSEGTFKKQRVDEFIERVDHYSKTISAHRVYLQPLIPFGESDSDVGLYTLRRLTRTLQRITGDVKTPTQAERDACATLIQELSHCYRLTNGRVGEVMKRIHAGKDIGWA